MSIPGNARTLILTCSVAAITATGAWYGAGLKGGQQAKEVCRKLPFSKPYLVADHCLPQTVKKAREATVEEKLARLQESRQELSRKKAALEAKIAELEERRHSNVSSKS